MNVPDGIDNRWLVEGQDGLCRFEAALENGKHLGLGLRGSGSSAPPGFLAPGSGGRRHGTHWLWLSGCTHGIGKLFGLRVSRACGCCGRGLAQFGLKPTPDQQQDCLVELWHRPLGEPPGVHGRNDVLVDGQGEKLFWHVAAYCLAVPIPSGRACQSSKGSRDQGLNGFAHRASTGMAGARH